MQIIEFMRNAGETRRFHTWPVLRQQNVAEHSWHVAMLVRYLAGPRHDVNFEMLIMAALTHDMAEHLVGDIPSPAKRTMDERMNLIDGKTFRQEWGAMEETILEAHSLDYAHLLSKEEARILKLADACDGALYCIRERMMGNKLIDACYFNFRNYIDEVRLPVGNDATHENTLIDHIDDMWGAAI